MSDITEPTPEETPAVEPDEEPEVEAHSVNRLQDMEDGISEPTNPGSNLSLALCT